MLLESLVQRANGVDAEEMDEFVLTWTLIKSRPGNRSASSRPAVLRPPSFRKTDRRRRRHAHGLPQEKRIKTIAGHEVIANIKARQQRLEFLSLKYWFRIETKSRRL